MERIVMEKAGSNRNIEENPEESGENPGIVSEFWQFLRQNRKWWLAPLILALLGVGGLLVLAGNNAAIAPFIYTLF